MGSAKLAAALFAALATAAATAQPLSGKEPAAPCAATTVHYTATRIGEPWVLAGTAFRGHLVYYSRIVGDGRVNQSDGLVAYAGVSGTVVWEPEGLHHRAGLTLSVAARQLDGDGRFTQRLRSREKRFSSRLTIPSPGCWRLTLRSGRLRASAVIEAVAPPAEPRCDPTPVFHGTPPHPRFGQITWLQATPRSDGVAAILFVSVIPGADSALIYAGGRAPEGWNTKFLWWSPHPGGSLILTGRRIDGVGRFQQQFGRASADEGTVFPSIVRIPTAGCWAVTVQTGRTAGLVVFQAVVTS